MRKSTLLLSIGMSASVAASAWLWTALETERSRNAELISQLGSQRVANPMEEAPRTSFAPMHVQNPDSKRDPPPSSTTAAREPPKEMSGLEHLERERQLMLDPAYRDARRGQVRLSLSWRRAALIRLLGFTPAQADAAIELEVDDRLRSSDEVTIDATDAEALKEARERYEVFRREQQDKLRALVGETKAARYREYLDSWPTRRQVENLRSELGEANALRDDQVEPLIAALHVERSRMQSEMEEYRDSLDWEGDSIRSGQQYGDRMTEQMKSMNARMTAAASSLLTNAQLAALQEKLQQSLDQFEASKQIGMIQSKLDEARKPGKP